MNLHAENSGFENSEVNTVVPGNASVTELLPYQSANSIVYKTRINGKWLLLKRISPEFREHPAYLSALEKEFDLGFNLDHPAIVKYLNKGQDSEGIYLLAEYIDGYSLRKIIRENTRGIKDFKLIEKILFQLLDALSYLHKQQIFHLDLKPENIVITHKGNNVKIIDFGLSGSDSYISVSSGTEKYCSPEQIKNPEKADGRSDMYSLGIIILECLTGSTDKTHISKLPQPFKDFVSQCTESAYHKRFFSAQDAIAFLTRKNKTKRTIPVILATVLFIIGTGIAFYSWNRNLFYENKPETKKDDVKNILKEFEESKILTAQVTAKAQKQISDTLISNEDSMKCVRLGEALWNCFNEKVKEYDKRPAARSRKSVVLDIKQSCEDEILKKWKEFSVKFNLGTARYAKAGKIYNHARSYSAQRMDSVVWKK